MERNYPMTTSLTSETPIEVETKYCCDCAHLIGVRYKPELAKERWKCGHQKNLHKKVFDVVTGLEEQLFILNFIHDLRAESAPESLCGIEGRWYKKYIEPEYHREPTIGGMAAVAVELEVFDADTLEKNRQAARELIENRRKQKLTGPDLDNL